MTVLLGCSAVLYFQVLIPLNVFIVMGADLEHDLLMILHCNKRIAVFPSPSGMSLTNLCLAGNNLMGTGKPLTFFYSVLVYFTSGTSYSCVC